MRVEHKVVKRTAARHRKSEDCQLVAQIEGQPFFAVIADGHGPDIQTVATQNLALNVVTDFGCLFMQNPDPQAFPAMCDEVQTRVVATFKKIPVGAVATCVVAAENGITIAQVGDCVVLKFLPDQDYCVDRLTQDHTPDHPSEIPRLRSHYKDGKFDVHIHERGNFCVSRLYCKKTKTTAAFTRSFGDPDFRPIVTHEPEVKSFDYASNDELYAVCSDGGEDTVRCVFRRLKNERVPLDAVFMETVYRFAQDEMPLRPDDDITIVFFRVLRDSPTS